MTQEQREAVEALRAYGSGRGVTFMRREAGLLADLVDEQGTGLQHVIESICEATGVGEPRQAVLDEFGSISGAIDAIRDARDEANEKVTELGGEIVALQQRLDAVVAECRDTIDSMRQRVAEEWADEGELSSYAYAQHILAIATGNTEPEDDAPLVPSRIKPGSAEAAHERIEDVKHTADAAMEAVAELNIAHNERLVALEQQAAEAETDSGVLHRRVDRFTAKLREHANDPTAHKHNHRLISREHVGMDTPYRIGPPTEKDDV